MDFKSLLNESTVIIADGGMGTMLFNLGLPRGYPPELWNIDHPATIRRIHRQYIHAGAQIILTNSFGGNRLRLAGHALRAAELNRAAAQLARQEADAAPHPVVVGGSMGPLGELLEPYGDISFDNAVDIFQEQAHALAEGGVNVFWIETMADVTEVQAAIRACQHVADGIPIVATLTFDKNERTMMGVTPEQAIETLGTSAGIVTLGANCGNGPTEIENVIRRMHIANGVLPLVAKSNVGLPRIEQGQAIYDTTPADMAAYARRVFGHGAKIIGACCGSTPDHIAAIATALRETG